MIKVGGNKREPDQDGDNEHVPDFTTEQIQDGLEFYRQALGRVTKHVRDKMAVANKVLKETVRTERPEDIDMSDINKLAAANSKLGWMNPEILEVCMPSDRCAFFYMV